MLQHFIAIILTVQVIRMVGESQEAVGVGGGSGPSSNKMPTLEEYGNNLTNQAKEVCKTAADIAATAACLGVQQAC